MAIKNRFKQFIKTDRPAVKTCLMIGGSGMAGVWLKSFTDNFSDQRNGELTGDGYSLTEFVHAIREEREPIASIHNCLGTMRLYEAVLARRKGVIELNGS